MTKFMGILITSALVALVVPVTVSAVPPAPSCTSTTQSQAGPYKTGWQVTNDLKHVKATGEVGGEFKGQCRGFVSGRTTVLVSHGSQVTQRVSKAICAYGRGPSCGPAEFKHGYNDTGKPFTYTQRFRIHQLVRGDCVRTRTKYHWNFQDGTTVPKGKATITTTKGCVS